MNDMRQMTSLGREIEQGSFSIIDKEAGPHHFTSDEWQIVRRVIHATADFEFKTLISFHPQAISMGLGALKRGCPIVADVKMIIAGLNQERLDAFGCPVHCRISDSEVIAVAKANNSTRAIEAMKSHHKNGELNGAIIAVGNAPTALLEVVRLIKEENVKPALIVGVPVGFVSAAQSKEAVLNSGIPFIVSRGRKGGSTIAVAILHALLYLSVERSS